MLASEKASRAPKTSLHFVNDQQRAALVAEIGYTTYILLRGDMDAAFTLHQFEQHGGGFMGNRVLCRRAVVVADMGHARDKRRERFAIMRLPCCRECPHRATVKAAQGSDDAGTSSRE